MKLFRPMFPLLLLTSLAACMVTFPPDYPDGTNLEDLTFKDASGAERAAYLIMPPKDMPAKGGILFVHWLGEAPKNDRTEFLDDAKELSRHGIVSMLVNQPWSEPRWFRDRKLENDLTMSQNEVKNLGLALDVLSRRLPKDVAGKVALVGHDFGAMYGTILAGQDQRINAMVLIAPTPRFSDWFLLGQKLDDETKRAYIDEVKVLDADEHLGKRQNLPMLFQFAKSDRYVPVKSAQAYFDAAPGPKEIRWYDTTHRMDDPAVTRDRNEWLLKWFGEGRDTKPAPTTPM